MSFTSPCLFHCLLSPSHAWQLQAHGRMASSRNIGIPHPGKKPLYTVKKYGIDNSPRISPSFDAAHVLDKRTDSAPVPNSCWTAVGTSMSDPRFIPGICQICVVQRGTGPVSTYEAWGRDELNSGMGSMSGIELGPGSFYSFSAEPLLLHMYITPSQSPNSPSAVTMMWGDPNAPSPPQMSFDPGTRETENCTLSQDAKDPATT